MTMPYLAIALNDPSIRLGIAAIYGIFFLLSLLALIVSRGIGKLRKLEPTSSLASPIGSLFTLTTAFLLSNEIFQVSNLRNAITEEVVTISKLSAIVAVLPDEQRIEARRLLYDYAYSIEKEESIAMRNGQRNESTQTKQDNLRDFFSSQNSILPSESIPSPENQNYLSKASEYSLQLIDSRERRLSLSNLKLDKSLWSSIYILFLAFSIFSFSIHKDLYSQLFSGLIILLAAPIPAVIIYIYSNPFKAGLIDIAQALNIVLSRNI